MKAAVIGAGLAGCEAAHALSARGVKVTLYEMKPLFRSAAHHSDLFAELVCSNSLKAERLGSAAGLLKEEMRRRGSVTLAAADKNRVAAGGALAVEREGFSRCVTDMISADENIEVVHRRVESLEFDVPVIVAAGPLCDGILSEDIARRCGGLLSFYDAAAPIVTADSIDDSRVFAASRYGRGEPDYINCPFDKVGYELFWESLVSAEGAQLHDIDIPLYEGCMPIERLAKRGRDAMRFGPLKPVGLTDPKTGHRPWAAVQLRREDPEGRLYNIVGFQTNLKFPEQKRVFSMIPGLENAEFARFGVMHRNTFIDSPACLTKTLRLREGPDIYFAGQITGFEGYMESALCGILVGGFVADALEKKVSRLPPDTTMAGALLKYVTTESGDFQPMGANFGIMPPLEEHIKDKQKRYEAYAERALEYEDYS